MFQFENEDLPSVSEYEEIRRRNLEDNKVVVSSHLVASSSFFLFFFFVIFFLSFAFFFLTVLATLKSLFLHPPWKSSKSGFKRGVVLGQGYIYMEAWRGRFQKRVVWKKLWCLIREVFDQELHYTSIIGENFQPCPANLCGNIALSGGTGPNQLSHCWLCNEW